MVIEGATIGDSIAVNGCCLTVVELGAGTWAADVVDETLGRTNLGALAAWRPGEPGAAGTAVATGWAATWCRATSTGVGEVVSPAPDLVVRTPDTRYVVEKGSVAVDGVSLTVAGVDDDSFRVAVIPHTAAVTTLGRRRAGDRVNLEFDILAKYVERLLAR